MVMLNHSIQIQTGNSVYKIIFGLLFLFCGCSIYLLFRSETLNIYQWCSEVGMSGHVDLLRCVVLGWAVPDFVKYSIPDGLYCAAYILMIDAIWGKQKGLSKYLIVSIIPIAAIVYEILQYFGIKNGTFDVCDLMCYWVPVLVYGVNEIIKYVQIKKLRL